MAIKSRGARPRAGRELMSRPSQAGAPTGSHGTGAGWRGRPASAGRYRRWGRSTPRSFPRPG